MTTPIQISSILLDAQSMAVQYPSTFDVPSIAELADIKVGDNVKIGAELGKGKGIGCERFWVEVIKVNESTIIGMVNNGLAYTDSHKLKYGDIVEFDFNCVMSIDTLLELP